MVKKYLLAFLVSMVPLIELRGGVPYAVLMGLDYWTALVICVIGNMLPVPIIYFFARNGAGIKNISVSSLPTALRRANGAARSFATVPDGVDCLLH